MTRRSTQAQLRSLALLRESITAVAADALNTAQSRASAAHDVAARDDDLVRLADERWYAHLGSDVFSPEQGTALATSLIERQTIAIDSQARSDIARQDCVRREEHWRLADAQEQAAHRLARRRIKADARKREEVQAADLADRTIIARKPSWR